MLRRENAGMSSESKVGILAAEYPKNVNIRGYKPNTGVHIGQLKRALKILQKARKPLFLAGGGVNIANAPEMSGAETPHRSRGTRKSW